MCTVVLSIGAGGVFVAANRDEMASRPWEAPGEYWPGICGGRDTLAGGTWLALNRAGVMAAVLNREGTLGPEAGKRSRGELPLLALRHDSAAVAAAAMAALDAGAYRPFNLVLADAQGAFLLRGLGEGRPAPLALAPGIHMVTAGEADDETRPRIARHLPRFRAAPLAQWAGLLGDTSGPPGTEINIRPAAPGGFGTVCASLVRLPREGRAGQKFAAGPPDAAVFREIVRGASTDKEEMR